MDAVNTSFLNPEQLPIVIEPIRAFTFAEFEAWLQGNEKELKKLLLKHGGFLLRGFPVDQVDQFNKVIDTLCFGECLDYIGGDSPRKKVAGKVYTSTEAAPSFNGSSTLSLSTFRIFLTLSGLQFFF